MAKRNIGNGKSRLSIKRVLDNNIFMFKLICRASPRLILLSIITMVIFSFFEFISGSLILRYSLNSINEGKSFHHLAQKIIIWMFLYVTISIIRTLFDEWIYKGCIIDVKKNIYTAVYQKAADVELACYENPEYYNKLVKAVDECGIRADELILALKNLMYRITSLVLNITLIVSINPILLFFSLIPYLVSFLRLKVNRLNYCKEMKIKEENRNKDYSRRVFYLADYAKEMRLSNMSFLMLVRFKESGERVIGIIKEYGFSVATLGYIVSECRNTVAPLGATFYAVWEAFVTKRIGYGDCLVIVNSIDVISSILTSSTNDFFKFQEHALYIENLRDFLDYEPQMKVGTERLPEVGDIILENVSFRYEGASQDSLHNISMRFGAKEKIAIVGHNGAGKTTLVKLLLRLYDSVGRITYGGIDIKELPLFEYRNMFSTVMQDFHIFSLSIAENVLLDISGEDDCENVKMALEKGGLLPKVDSFSKGIDTILTKEFDEAGEILSGGEQQKIAISHVYSKKNRFVILDEPSSALDPIAEYEMYNKMLDICKNCGMIFISHRLSSAVLADCIYLLENGSIIESGSHTELMLQNGKYAEMFNRQAANYVEG